MQTSKCSAKTHHMPTDKLNGLAEVAVGQSGQLEIYESDGAGDEAVSKTTKTIKTVLEWTGGR